MAAEKRLTAKMIFSASRLLLGSVFLWACWDKIIDPPAFAQAIANYQIVPRIIANISALILPWLELVCGVTLIMNRWTRGSALITAVLMIIFMGALGVNMYRGMDISCGCFTLDEQVPGNMWFYLARDAVFLALAVIVLSRPRLNSAQARSC